MTSRLSRIYTMSLLLLAATGTACKSSRPVATEQSGSPTANTLTAGDQVKWYQACWNDFNTRKWEDFKDCYAKASTSQQFGYGKQNVRGPDNIVSSWEDFAKAFPDSHGHPQLILINGNNIASIYLLNAANTGTIRKPNGKDVPATNKKIGLLFGNVVETDPNARKIVNEFGVMDSGTIAGQLGLSKDEVRPVMYQGEAMPTVVIARNDETEMKNIAVEKMALEAWNRHDVVSADMYMSDDFFFRAMYAPNDILKSHAFDRAKDFWRAFPDAKLHYSKVWAAGDYVAVLAIIEGINEGDLPGAFRRTGKKLAMPFMAIDRLADGKIKETWLFVDAPTFMSQLGLSGE